MRLNETLSKRHALAKEFAKIAHDDMGQVRKGSGARYWTHPLGVSDILEAYGASEPVCCAACLHDVVEDAEITIETIRDIFGAEIAELVSEVTNTPGLDGMDKEFYMSKKMTELSSDALSIKLADCIYNLLDRPRRAQIERMYKNIAFMRRHRELEKLHRALMMAFIKGYKSKVNLYK